MNKHLCTKFNNFINEKLNMEKYKNIQAGVWSNDIFSDLLDVGTKKALGYLPLSTIIEYGGRQAKKDLIQWAIEKDLKYKLFVDGDGDVASGALYIWDENMLRDMLNKYQKILLDAGVPITPDHYVYYINHNIVYDHIYPLAFEVIGKTFNDKRFR